MKAPTREAAGFTLIELTISAAIASIILVASYLCLSAAVASQKLIEPRIEALQSARVALAMMSADLRSACSLSTNYDFLGTQRAIGDIEADNLDFATHYYMPARPNEGDYCQVSYHVDKSRAGQGLSLWRRRNPRLAPDPLSGGSEEEIAPGVRGLTLEYYDGVETWYDNWGDANVNEKVKYTTVQATNLSGFPQAVRITLQVDPDPSQSGEKAEPPLVFRTVVRLEAPNEIGVSGAAASATPADGDNGGPPGQNPGGGN